MARLDKRIGSNIPSFIHISDGKWHEVNFFNILVPEAGAFYIMDLGYIDFEQLHRLHQAGSFYVIRAKSNLRFQRRYSLESDRAAGIICDQTGTLTGFYSSQDYTEEQIIGFLRQAASALQRSQYLPAGRRLMRARITRLPSPSDGDHLAVRRRRLSSICGLRRAAPFLPARRQMRRARKMGHWRRGAALRPGAAGLPTPG